MSDFIQVTLSLKRNNILKERKLNNLTLIEKNQGIIYINLYILFI